MHVGKDLPYFTVCDHTGLSSKPNSSSHQEVCISSEAHSTEAHRSYQQQGEHRPCVDLGIGGESVWNGSTPFHDKMPPNSVMQITNSAVD